MVVLKIVQLGNDAPKLSPRDRSHELGIETRYPAFRDLRSGGYGYSRVQGIHEGEQKF